MTNDCWNVYTIIGNTPDIQELYRNELERLTMVKNPSDGNVVEITYFVDKGIHFRFWSGNSPNKEWMEKILEEYPTLWVKNRWSEEGGTAGVIVGGMLYGAIQEVKELMWNDLVIEDEFHEHRM
jgi:hypothetical protein